MKILVDADSLVYRIGFAAENEDEGIAVARLSSTIANKFPAPYNDAVYFILSGDYNYRKQVAVTRGYKENRKDQAKPKHYDRLRQELYTGWGGYHSMVATGEADDAIAIKCENGDIICSNDKDFKQIPMAYLWDWTKESWKEWNAKSHTPTPRRQAAEALARQIMTGDPVDNIVGIPGIGIQKARKYIKDNETLSKAILVAYLDYYRDLELAKMKMYETARLVYLQREKGDVWKFPRTDNEMEAMYHFWLKDQ